MPKLKAPLFSLKATGRLGKFLTLAKRQGRHIIERRPIPTDAKSPTQLFSRLMFTKCVDLWHLLSDAERQEWESAARPKHMTGYAWYISQCLRPNPGIYLPLIGGTMQGIIDMDGFKISDLLDPVAVQDADTKAARDAAIAAAIGGSLTCDIYGFDGNIWQKLLVESAAQHNLRVRLYAGANALTEGGFATGTFDHSSKHGLDVRAHLYTRENDADARRVSSLHATPDDSTGYGSLPAGILAWNGSKWDRLRAYPTGILKVGRAEIGLSDLRRVGAGQVKAAPGKLYWMTMNPTAANSVIELTDDLNGLGAVKWDMTHGVNSAHHMNFDPPLEFATGIYLKTLTNFTSVIFGYL